MFSIHFVELNVNKNRNYNYKNLTIWIAIGCFFFLVVQTLVNIKDNENIIPYSEFISEVDAGKVSNVTIKGLTVEGVFFII